MPSVTDLSVPGGWSDREVIVGGHRFQLYTPRDPDEFLVQLEEPSATAPPHLADPYWAKLWPAAPLLAAAILRHRPPPGTRVLELGCGSGLAGMAALACDLDVTFSDYVPLAVELALENAARNGFRAAKGMVLDWRQPTREQFQMILAADVLYDRTHLDPLLTACDKMLSPAGEAWFGDAGRGPAEDFLERALRGKWRVVLYDENDAVLTAPKLGCCQRFVLRRP